MRTGQKRIAFKNRNRLRHFVTAFLARHIHFLIVKSSHLKLLDSWEKSRLDVISPTNPAFAQGHKGNDNKLSGDSPSLAVLRYLRPLRLATITFAS